MLGFVSCLHPQIPSTSPNLCFTFRYSSLFPKPQIHTPKYPSPSRFILFAQTGNNNDDLTKQPNKKPEEKGNDGGDSRDDRRSIFNFRLGDLLDPDPENIVALGLTGLLTWASVQVLWQLFLISGAILLAALKYSFIAALLLFILITLL
ncbi:hypothetical protein like AT4G40045 [Hibiscus trionum]|uniref:Transmembrane protein n=1 Tax=Hibiscus trionum TaxID=183268 RepID=A0A9W7I8A8_HIBTR|nr:hypothetical protein like AT4G40045 [Hibiscus trionum]